MTSRPRELQEEAGGDQQQQRKSKRRRSGPQFEKKDQEQAMELEATNGSLSSFIGQRGLINRSEYLRLLQQSLSQLGFNDIAEQLENRSGVPRQSSTTSSLTECVLNGNWEGALQAVGSLDLAPKIASQVCFLILERKFEEILKEGDELAAIKCLRNDLAPLGVNTERLHELSRKLASSNSSVNADGNVKDRHSPLSSSDAAATAAEAIEKSTTAGRRKLLAALHNIVPAGTLLPENRLEELVEQALTAQIDKCGLHNTLHPQISLLRNYSCGREQLPLNCSQVLEAHTSEVWHLQFSHNGKMLATCGRDNKVIVWDIEGENEEEGNGGSGGGGTGEGSSAPPHSSLPPWNTNNNKLNKATKDNNSRSSSSGSQVKLRRILSGHTAPVLFLAWSDDDSLLASCGQDSHVRLWNPTAATAATSCVRVLRHHNEPVLSASWLPDNKTLVTAGQDRMVAVVGIDGDVVQNWRAHRMQDVTVTAGGRYILASTHDRRINVYEALVRPVSIIGKDVEELESMIEKDNEKARKKHQDRLNAIRDELAEKRKNKHTENEWLFSARFDSQKQKDSTLLEGEDLMAFSTSPCGRYLLANLRDGTLSLWDLGSRKDRTLKIPVGLVSRFSPPGNPKGNLGRFIVRSCLGGVDGKFVTTGTESGKVPIWQRDTGELLAVLEGHTGVVNAVAWNSKRPEMMATASDDGTIRIWTAAGRSSGSEDIGDI